MPGDERESLDRLRALQRDAETGGPQRLLDRIAEEIDGHAALFTPDGTPLTPHRELPGSLAETARRLRGGEARSVVEHDGAHRVAAFALSAEPDAPTLALAGPSLDRFTTEPARTDALRLLALSWRAHHAHERWRRADEAGDQVREAVLHLLIDGALPAAHRTAGALGDPLPDPMRVWVVEIGALERGDRDAVADRLVHLTGGRAWMIKCPVYSGHLIPAVPPMDHERERACLAELVATATESTGRISVGISNVLPLRDYAVGYQQAFHALAHARGNAERFATFGRGHDLAAEIAGAGQRWARQVLAGLEEFSPQRPQDPTREELRGTLTSWLMFHQQAARHLKIHRNTLQARLHKIGALLDRDLHRLHDQACVDLALRLRNSGAADASAEADLDALLRAEAVRRWAAQLLDPLRASPRLRETVRAWLLADARLPETAEALGLSTTAVRKRLVRAEQLLERSLLHSPSLSYDLHLAFRALNPLG
ncbi:helix-turn-helix domain-containing protein [Saccharopolyspora flava]|uniref:PucR C-terminal helix-turn-helix domain-containing protein n=1 Tax=Saccharopolyspora flava TaxID=95161 RepID=A0A1I6NTD8_9PSEU|nr:helix-turn-helix domain-containing protein [Saccharopolyspora flava]SFS31286.1 PucR C-terminal helix-turn-helix domain-containing protein [Saccharopolyspora flava]